MGKISKTTFHNRLATLPKQEHALCIAAVFALTAAGFPTKAGWCQMWVRLVWEIVFGLRFDFLAKKSARLTALAARKSRYYIAPKDGSKPGDILFKGVPLFGFGHVGIRLLGNMVAENSTIHWDGKDARGLRTIEEFGKVWVILRLK